MSHSDLDALDNFLDKKEEKEKEIEWDIEDMKRAYKDAAEQLCGLDRNVMANLLKGKWSHYTTSDHSGRTSKKIVIEYDIESTK